MSTVSSLGPLFAHIFQTLHLVDLSSLNDIDAQDFILSYQLMHSHRLQREEAGLPPLPPEKLKEKFLRTEQAPEQFVQVVEQNNWDDFGFVLFCTSYGDDEKFEKWETEYDVLLQASMDQCTGGGVERVREQLMTLFVVDEALDGLPFASIPRYGYWNA